MSTSAAVLIYNDPSIIAPIITAIGCPKEILSKGATSTSSSTNTLLLTGSNTLIIITLSLFLFNKSIQLIIKYSINAVSGHGSINDPCETIPVIPRSLDVLSTVSQAWIKHVYSA